MAEGDLQHDLTDVGNEELIDELSKRFDCFTFAGEQKTTPQDYERIYRWGGRFGGATFALGLLDRFWNKINAIVQDEEMPDDED